MVGSLHGLIYPEIIRLLVPRIGILGGGVIAIDVDWAILHGNKRLDTPDKRKYHTSKKNPYMLDDPGLEKNKFRTCSGMLETMLFTLRSATSPRGLGS